MEAADDYLNWTRPSRAAARTACVKFPASRRTYTAPKWLLTVLDVIPMRRAACMVDNPSATSCNTDYPMNGVVKCDAQLVLAAAPTTDVLG